MEAKPKALDFFSGSGLVTEGISGHFDVVWANDMCPKKNAVYVANFGEDHLERRSIAHVNGKDVPTAHLAWASFPCQDLSLAGNMKGMSKGDGTRSSLFWEWIRVLDEMGDRQPPVVCVENVVGFLVADKGAQFSQAYNALRERGYRCGAMVINAVHFVPQSRPRSFLVAAKNWVDIGGKYNRLGPDMQFHSKSVITAFQAVSDPAWVWWCLPMLPQLRQSLLDLCDLTLPVDPPEVTKRLLGMLSDINREKLERQKRLRRTVVGTGYKRIRAGEDGIRRQRLEIRFDVAGCLRTPNGGSSRQTLIIVNGDEVHTRLLSVREAARLMGAPDAYKVPGSFIEGYWAMGDAVAVPVTRWLAAKLLSPLAREAMKAQSSALVSGTGID